MAQNVGDDPHFADAGARLPRSMPGLTGAPEWATVRTLLPDARAMDGADVVDLGCGDGAFCRWAAEQGAGSVLGLDLSTRMLDVARAFAAEARDRSEPGGDDGPDGFEPGPEGAIHYEQSDLDQVSLRYASYDLAFSALSLHYLADPLRFFRTINAGLRPGGRLVLTCEHPILTAPSRPGFVEVDGRRVWALDGYAEEGVRITARPAPGLRREHRTLGTTLTALARAGLVLRELVEWAPSLEQVAERPEWAGGRDRPTLLLLRADKPNPGALTG